MNKELQELKIQLDEWIRKTDPNMASDKIDKLETMASLSTLLIVREWVTNKLTEKFRKDFMIKSNPGIGATHNSIKQLNNK